MPQTANHRSSTQRALGALYEPIRDELVQFEEILRRELCSDDPFVKALVQHGFRLGGKRLRPALVLLAAKAVGEITHEHLVLAAVVEMIHTATLVHDDVLDDAAMRRHLDTVNVRWGNQTSVLLGDYLFTHAFHLASTLDTTFACRTIGRATNRVCEGELRQIDTQGRLSLTEAEYLDIIAAKTGELCACACRLGAHYAGAGTAPEDRLARYGRNLGIAFQIVDDLLDLEGDESTIGKSLGTDLDQCKSTLPMVRLWELSDESKRRELATIMGQSGHRRRQALEPWFACTAALDYARQKAASFAEQARSELGPLAPSAARTALRRLTEFVVQRCA
ncbi:MAG TPA: polyprenyl synthetase family protein [Pirellulales bacterium]|jgi:octaprenyl-diphosphate synthase|nr:polyprenyl synthetase family protein [Pirellulales bacterium]